MVAPDSTDTVRLKKKADTLLNFGDYSGAIQLYMKAIELDPKYAAAWNNMGYAYFKLGKSEEARRCCSKKEELLSLQQNGLSEKSLRRMLPVDTSEIGESEPNEVVPIKSKMPTGALPSSEVHVGTAVREEEMAEEPASKAISPERESLSRQEQPEVERSLLEKVSIPRKTATEPLSSISHDGGISGKGNFPPSVKEEAPEKTREKLSLNIQSPVHGESFLSVLTGEIPGKIASASSIDSETSIPQVKRIVSNDMCFYFLSFLIVIFLLAFVIPVLFYPHPWGSDVYAHMVHTERMYKSDSLVDFVDTSKIDEALYYDYPFVMWYLGSILMAITGADVYQLVMLFPLILVVISLCVYYVYSKKLLKKREWALLSLIFLISMPQMATTLLNYQTSRFVPVFLFMTLYIIVDKERKWQNLIFLLAIPFVMVITHTGTYMFLIFFTASYFILYALIWNKFDWWVFALTTISIFMYVIAVQEFQFVQPQFIDKGRLVISVTEKIASFSGQDIIRDMGIIFYDNLFVTNNMSYAIFWSALIFSLGVIAIYLHTKIVSKKQSFRLTLPVIGSISHVSHGIVTTPFWIGPIQTILSFFGVFFIDSRGKCIFLAVMISAVLPASMQADVGTGALRQIYYLILIIPITAAAGMMFIHSKIHQWQGFPLKKKLCTPLLLLIFLPLIVAPIVASVYYVPTISGTDNERENLMWLGTVGTAQEGVSGYGYRERIDIYSQKKTPIVQQGTETRSYLAALNEVYFSGTSEQNIAELNSFNVQYLISSKRILEAFNAKYGDLTIDANSGLDKIFSSDDFFGIYHSNNKATQQTMLNENENHPSQGIVFVEQPVTIQDEGSHYVVDTTYYKLRLAKTNPSILYLGTDIDNMLGDGYFQDEIALDLKKGLNNTRITSEFSKLSCDSVNILGNTIVYEGTIKNDGELNSYATFRIIFTFFEKSIKNDVQIINDQEITYPSMTVTLATKIFSPASSFDYRDLTSTTITEISRRFYPSLDSIPIRDVNTNQIFLDTGGKGIMIHYEDSAPFPERILYKGSEEYGYGLIYIESAYSPSPGEAYQYTRYFSLGEKQEAIRNIDEYTSVSVYDYPEGTIPFVIISPRVNEKEGWDGVLNFSQPESNLFSYTVTGYLGMKDYPTQTEELAGLSMGQGTAVIVLPDLQYNINTIKSLSDNSIKGLAGFPVNPPTAWLFREGRRNLKEAYYKGEPTGLLLVPVSLPQSGIIGRGVNQDEVFNNWHSVIDSCLQYGGITVFFWDPEDFKSSDLQEKLNNVIQYTGERGMSITSLNPLIDHKLLLKNVGITVEKNIDSVILEIRNNNQEYIRGMTTRVVLPEIGGNDQYIVSEGGRIVRIDKESESDILYISCDLAPGEMKNITIAPSGERKRFGIDFTKLYHGMNTLVIRDDSGKTVSNALVTVGAISYKSNSAGEVKFYVRRGITNISVEKPGFRSRNVQIDIKSKFSKYFENIIQYFP